MKINELMPKDENLIKTFIDDSIGRNEHLYYFICLLNSLDENASISLDGEWGSGKTFFVKQTKIILDSFNDSIKSNTFTDEDKKKIKEKFMEYNKNDSINIKDHMTIYYDCWQNDNHDDPILSLIYSIVQNVSTNYSLKKNEFIKKAATILEIVTKRDWKHIIESMKSEDPLNEIKKEKDLQEEINEFLASLIEEVADRLIIIIDELDRCNPNYAVKLLERIKHYFNNDKITFVFSINKNQLQHTIAKHYGNNFDACRYLDRFFNLRIQLPNADLNKYFKSFDFNHNEILNSVCWDIINKYKFQLREIVHFLNSTKVSTYKAVDINKDLCFGPEKSEMFCIYYIIPLMIALQSVDVSKYNDFINGKDYTELLDLFSNLNKNNTNYLDTEYGLYIFKNKTDKSEIDEEFIKKLYDAIFVNQYDNNNSTSIGKCEFNKYIKDNIFNTSSLLSGYANYDPK